MGRAQSLYSVPVPTIRNRDNFPAYERPLEERYLQTLLTNTVGNTFYADQQTLMQESDQVHNDMLDVDPEFAAKALAFARNEGFMRLQPILGLAKLSAVKQTLFARAFPHVIKIPSDLSDFLTILNGQGRGEGGRAVKREVGGFLNGVSEYWALKYNGRGRGYSIGDMVATAHVKAANDRQNRLFRYAMGKETPLGGLPQLAAFEALKRAETDDERIRWINEGKLPHEIVTGAIKPTKAVWNAILEQMPIFALLRNLNTMDRAGVLDERQAYISARLTDGEALRKSKILPFRFLSAYNEVQKPWLKDALRQAVELTFDNLPNIDGRTAVFLDISGSMDGQYLRIGSVFALALYKKTGGDSLFWLFNTQVGDAQPSRVDSILSQAERIRSFGGTDTGAPVRALLGHPQPFDNIIIITDEQQNVGSPFYRELLTYRQARNQSARAYVIDLAPYQSGMVPPSDKLTHYLYGWSDAILSYIAQSQRGYGDMVQAVRGMEL